jgi:hypothetical protein
MAAGLFGVGRTDGHEAMGPDLTWSLFGQVGASSGREWGDLVEQAGEFGWAIAVSSPGLSLPQGFLVVDLLGTCRSIQDVEGWSSVFRWHFPQASPTVLPHQQVTASSHRARLAACSKREIIRLRGVS